jgi:hypothetical protein
LTILPLYVRVLRALGIRVAEYLTCLRPTLESAAVMAVVVLTTRALLPPNWPLGLRFGIQVTCGAAAYLAAALVLQRRRLKALADFFRAVRSA